MPTEWVYLGITEEMQYRTHKLGQTRGKLEQQRREAYFSRKKEEVGKDCFKEFRVVMFSHCLNVAVSHWLGGSQELEQEGKQLKRCR